MTAPPLNVTSFSLSLSEFIQRRENNANKASPGTAGTEVGKRGKNLITHPKTYQEAA